jgi:hypothetical protein
MALPTSLQRVVDWLHAGYPAGVPSTDYYPVLALLARHLSDSEVIDAADSLALSLPLPPNTNPKTAILEAIHAVTDTPPLNSDVERVRRHLEAVGWSLDGD